MSDRATVDVLVVGDLNPDLIIAGTTPGSSGGQVEQDAEIAMTLGGSGGICASGLARLGLGTALYATIGDDDIGAAAKRMLASAGVRTEAVTTMPGRRSGLSVHLLATRDRSIYTDRGSIMDLQVDGALHWLRVHEPRHVHLCSLYLIPALVADGMRLVDAAHSSGATVSLDPNYDPSDRFERPDWITRVDYLLPNDTEALRLTGRSPGGDIEAAARDLAGDGALVAVKCGPRGAIAVHGSQRVEARPSRPVDLVDAVGAGDTFDAGLVRAMLDERGLADTLAFACACGTLSTRAAGGTGAQPDLREAYDFMGLLALGQAGAVTGENDDGRVR